MSLAAIPAYFLARRLLPATLSLVCAGARGAHPLDALHGDADDRERVLPALPPRRVPARADARGADARSGRSRCSSSAGSPSRRARRRSRSSPPSRPRRCCSALIERRGAARHAASLRLALRPPRRRRAARARRDDRGRPLAAQPARRLPRRHLELLHRRAAILHFFLYHVAELDLYLGILPFAALLALWLAPRRPTPGRAGVRRRVARDQRLAARRGRGVRVGELRQPDRGAEHLLPGAARADRARRAWPSTASITRRRRVLVAAALVAGILPFFIPYTRFITTSAVSDTFALLPWWWAQDNLIHLAAGALGRARRLARRRRALRLPAAPVRARPARARRRLLRRDRVRRRERPARDPQDDRRLALGGNAHAAPGLDRPARRPERRGRPCSGRGRCPRRTRSTRTSSSAAASAPSTTSTAPRGPTRCPRPTCQPAAERRARRRRTASPIHAQYVLASGERRARRDGRSRSDDAGVALYRVNGPIVILPSVRGPLPERHLVGARRSPISGSSARAARSTFSSRATRTCSSARRRSSRPRAGPVVGRKTIPVSTQTTLTVPLRPGANGRCVVRFTVGRTLVPAKVEPGSTDTRPLGAHFLNFTYNP